MKKWNRLMKTHFIVLFSVLLLSCTLLCGLIVGAGFAASDETWNNHTSEMIYSGGYYNIGTAEQLACFNKNLSTYRFSNIRLTADIDMSKYNNKVCYWVPNSSTYSGYIGLFMGTFDGNGHTISGINIKDGSGSTNSSISQAGLFRTLYEATIKNLVLKNFTINGVIHAGALAGKAWKTTIDNVRVYDSTIKGENLGTTNLSDNIHVGGICGAAVRESKITNCWVNGSTIIASNTKSGVQNNYGTVLNTLSGGIVGWGSKLQIEGCKSDGNGIYTYNPNLSKIYIYNSYAGGIVGELTGEWDNTKVSRCSNTSNVYGGMDAGSSNCNIECSMVGGIAGKLSYGKIENCYNTGSLSGYAKIIASRIKTFNPAMKDGKTEIYLGLHDWGRYYLNSVSAYESIEYNNVFIGGAGGLIDNGTSVTNFYNTGTIDKYDYYRIIDVSFEMDGWDFTKSSGRCNLDYGVRYCIGKTNSYTNNIVGCNNGSANLTKCYYKDAMYTDLDYCVTGYVLDDGIKCPFEGWEEHYIKVNVVRDIEYSERTYWENGRRVFESTVTYKSFDFIINPDLDNDNNVKLYVFKGDSQNDSYELINNYGQYSGTLNIDDGTQGITVSDSTLSPDYWAVDSNINGGLPHLKDFYWQDS